MRVDVDGSPSDQQLTEEPDMFGKGGVTVGGSNDPQELTDNNIRRNFVGDIKAVS